MKPMHKVRIRRQIGSIILLQAVILCALSAVCLLLFYTKHTATLQSQVATTAELYATVIDHRIDSIEKLTYALIVDQAFQKQSKDSNTGFSISGRLSWLEMEKVLISYLFSTPTAKRICFITLTGQQLFGTYESDAEKFTANEVAAYRLLAESSKGKPLWFRNQRLHTMDCVRLIKNSTLDSRFKQFEPLGVLIISCDTKTLLHYHLPNTQPVQMQTAVTKDGALVYAYGTDGHVDSVISAAQPLTPESIVYGGVRYWQATRLSAINGFSYHCLIPGSVLLHDFNVLSFQIILIFVVVTALALLLSFHYSLVITKAIEGLSKTMAGLKDRHFQRHRQGKNADRIAELCQLSEDYNYMAGQIEHLINDVYKKQIMIKDMSYRILQTQINPHFINNSLTMLDTLSKRNEPEKVTLIIQSISKMVRAAYAGNDMITLDEELDFLKAYLNVQKVRYEDRLFIEIDTVPECGLALIPKLTLQPITENSIKYGLESVEGRCEIHLSAHENGENVVIEISDNGPGMSEELIMGVLTGTVNARGSGLGIKNVHERIRIMFGENYGLAMRSGKTGGMTTTITIPGRKEPTDVQDAHRG